MVNKRYGGVAALTDLSFDVVARESFGIAGPNGAGKTTLFDVITGRTSVTAGQVLLHGEDITRAPAHIIARRGLCRTFQTPLCFPDLTARENVQVAAHFAAGPGTEAGRVEEVLETCQLSARAEDPARLLNVLDRKRLMIASALAAEPSILLLDEPMGGLNQKEREGMIALLAGINRAGTALVVIEHVMSALVALVNRVMVLREGQLIFIGTPDAMLRDPEVVRSYLGEEAQVSLHGNDRGFAQ